ncbi:MAG: hypothetical protein Q4G67_13305 [Actinomycetia bacterium]|nr:hypothetical protein [Actinomycetes bacterium]
MDRQALNIGIWDVEDGTERAPVRDYLCSKISTRDVEEFCRRYHYTGTGGNMSWRYGLWDGINLLGVVSYNLPTRDTCEAVFGSEHFDKVWHMDRLAMADDAPRNSESRLIGLSLKMIQAEYPNTWGVLTYAATDVGHIGYVYQATNALYTGIGGDSHYFTDATGVRRSTYLGGRGVGSARAAEMGWTRHEGGGKHRYLYILGSKTQRRHRRALLRLPVLPYPKET